LAAHYGIILNQVQSALHLSHFGEAVEIIASTARSTSSSAPSASTITSCSRCAPAVTSPPRCARSSPPPVRSGRRCTRIFPVNPRAPSVLLAALATATSARAAGDYEVDSTAWNGLGDLASVAASGG